MNLIFSSIFLVLSVVLTKVFCSAAQDTRLMDKPNERSMHSRPTVRGGGVVFIGLAIVVLPILCYVTRTPFREVAIYALCVSLLAVVGFIDDLFNLSVKPRFLVQSSVALLVALFLRPDTLDFGLFAISTPVFTVPFIFMTVLWAINHFNFMDGIDGFCASQAVFLFAAYALLFAMSGALFYQSYCLVLIFSLAGFLVFNLPPAKLFMGDVGSATLGFITIGIALIAQQRFQIPIIYWFILNGLFLFDATCTLIRRMIKKEKWAAPHRKHAYQRLRQSGSSVPVILLGQLLLNVSFLLLVVLFQRHQFHLSLLLLLQLGLMLCVYCFAEKKLPMFQSEVSY